MRTIAAFGLVVLFVLLAALHVYWGLGGRLGSSVVVPEVAGKPAFQPSRTACFSVALLLSLAAVVIGVRANFVPGPALLASIGTWTLFLVFAARALGDFKRVGLFKSSRSTAFARYDTFLFSPLCGVVALACLLLALSP